MRGAASAHALSSSLARFATVINFHCGWDWDSFKKVGPRMRIVHLPARPSSIAYWVGVVVISRLREVDLQESAWLGVLAAMASEAKPKSKQLKRLGSVRAIAIKKVRR